MNWLRAMWVRLGTLLERERRDGELSAEIESHLQMHIDDNLRRGMTPEEARRAALIALGGVEQTKEACRERRGLPWVESLWQDVRFGGRLLWKNPGFTTVAVITLALGIGANTAIFSILDPLVLRKLPVHDPDSLVWVDAAGTLGPSEGSGIETFNTYRDKATVFSGLLAFSQLTPLEISYDGRKAAANGDLVSQDYFSALGLTPFTGRFFGHGGGAATPEVVISFGFWTREFEADRSVIGKEITFGDEEDAPNSGTVLARSYVIAGVAPPSFSGLKVGEEPDFYLPIGSTDLAKEDWVTIVGRLKPGVSIPQAEADLDPLLAQDEGHPMVPEVELREVYSHSVLTPAARGLSEARDKFGRPAQILMGIAVLVLLIACGNVANLLLSQSIARRREFMIRVALGAGRWRVARQVLTEGALLAAAGTGAGLLAGRWASALLAVSLSTRGLPITLSTRLDSGLLLFTAVTLTATILLCGLAPALISSRSDFADDLKVQGSLAHRSLGEALVGATLVAAQVTLAMVLLAGAGLLLHSLFNLETMNAGFDRDKVLLVTMKGYSASRTRPQMTSFYDELLSRVKELPGVRSTSYSNLSPIGGREIGINVAVDGYTFRPGEEANELFAGVSPGYFATMGIPLLEGREFTDADVQTANSVAIINRTMARRFFGDASPLGRHFHFAEGGKRPPLEIIGVAADSKYNDLRENATDFFYIPGTRGDLEIRTTMAAAAVAGPLREIVRSLDSSVSITEVRTLREQVDESLHSDRLIAALSSVFSGLALVLTAVGLYGVLAAGVARRTGEIGIRMALGARPTDLFRLVVLQGMWLTVCGLLVGLVAALGAGRLLGAILFGVEKTDPLTFVGVSIVLLATAFLACYVPARRAMRVDPMVALRHE